MANKISIDAIKSANRRTIQDGQQKRLMKDGLEAGSSGVTITIRFGLTKTTHTLSEQQIKSSFKRALDSYVPKV